VNERVNDNDKRGKKEKEKEREREKENENERNEQMRQQSVRGTRGWKRMRDSKKNRKDNEEDIIDTIIIRTFTLFAFNTIFELLVSLIQSEERKYKGIKKLCMKLSA